MKRLITIIYMTVLSLPVFSQSFDWVKNLGGIGDDMGKSIALDSFGNIYTTGYFSGTADFDPGSSTFNLTSEGKSDVFVSKLDSSGKFVWAKSFGGDSTDIGNSIGLDKSGNIFITGSFSKKVDFDPTSGTFYLTSAGISNAFISKLDTNGNLLWVKQLGDTLNNGGKSLTLDKSGNVYLTGYSHRNDFYNYSPYRFFVSKLNSQGNFIWQHKIGSSTENCQGNSICLDTNNYVYITGFYSGIVDFNPGVGTYTLTAPGQDIFHEGEDYASTFILKLDSSGNFVIAKAIEATGATVHAESITVDKFGNIYTTGYFLSGNLTLHQGQGIYGTIDFDPGMGVHSATGSPAYYSNFILKLDFNGGFVWVNESTKIYSGLGTCILTDKSGDVYVSGVMKLKGSGNYIWDKSVGKKRTYNNSMSSLTLDPQGNIYSVGYFSGTAKYNADSITASGGNDIVISKLTNSDKVMLAIQDNLSKEEFNVYPNPTNSIISIRSNNNDVGQPYYFIDITGKYIISGKLDNEISEIDIEKLSPGFYFLQIGEKPNKRFKIIKY